MFIEVDVGCCGMSDDVVCVVVLFGFLLEVCWWVVEGCMKSFGEVFVVVEVGVECDVEYWVVVGE